MPTLTYIDSCVLIASAARNAPMAAKARPFLADENREYVTSDYVKLEVLPKAIYHKNKTEEDTYNSFFALCVRSVPTSDALMKQAMEEAAKTGMSGFDALHIVCAVFGGAEEFITTEKTSKPMHRTKLVKVISIEP